MKTGPGYLGNKRASRGTTYIGGLGTKRANSMRLDSKVVYGNHSLISPLLERLLGAPHIVGEKYLLAFYDSNGTGGLGPVNYPEVRCPFSSLLQSDRLQIKTVLEGVLRSLPYVNVCYRDMNTEAGCKTMFLIHGVYTAGMKRKEGKRVTGNERDGLGYVVKSVTFRGKDNSEIKLKDKAGREVSEDKVPEFFVKEFTPMNRFKIRDLDVNVGNILRNLAELGVEEIIVHYERP